MNNDTPVLTTEHICRGCQCTSVTRTIDVSYPAKARIQVLACTEMFQRAPLRSAMDVLGAAAGRRIVSQREAADLVLYYSTLSPNAVLAAVPRVLGSPHKRQYYVKRDILRACARKPRRKCGACGSRCCNEADHEL